MDFRIAVQRYSIACYQTDMCSQCFTIAINHCFSIWLSDGYAIADRFVVRNADAVAVSHVFARLHSFAVLVQHVDQFANNDSDSEPICYWLSRAACYR